MDSAMTVGPVSAQNNPAAGVFFILVGMQPTSGAPDERANNA
jgi:hypothetical protein